MSPSNSGSESIVDTKDVDIEEKSVESRFDPLVYYERNAGRLVVEPEYVSCPFLYPGSALRQSCREARIEFGDSVAAQLKLSKDGTKVLWPQPSDDPEDPQNVRTTSLALSIIR